MDLVIGCVRLAKHLLEDREASALGNDIKIVIKSSLQVMFSHVHDYIGWLVQCPKSLKKKPTPGQNFFLVPPCLKVENMSKSCNVLVDRSV